MDDTDAIARLKACDIAGLQILVEMYQVEAVQVACLITGDRAAAEDVVQSAFLKVYEKIQGSGQTRPLRPWFLRVVVNDALKAAVRQRGRVSLDDDEADCRAVLERLDITAREPEDLVQRKELVEEMQRALDRLSPTQRAAAEPGLVIEPGVCPFLYPAQGWDDQPGGCHQKTLPWEMDTGCYRREVLLNLRFPTYRNGIDLPIQRLRPEKGLPIRRPPQPGGGVIFFDHLLHLAGLGIPN